jgi:MFS family permease
MTIATAMIAFAPTYAAIGIAAPAIMVLARLLQGAATGGEFASATAFLIESSPPERRGFFGSLQMVGQSIAALSGATAGMLVTQGLTPEQIDAWGWRLPFLFGLLIGPVGLWMRRHLSETEEFVAASQDETQHLGLMAVLREHYRDVLVCFGLVVSTTIMFYVVLIYMPTYAKTQLNIPLKDAFTAQVAGLIFLTVLIPLFGILSDRIGRRAVLMLAALLYLVLTYPMMAWMLAEPSLIRLAVMQVALCSAIAVGFGAISTALAEQFPVRQRSTGLALAYNMAVMIFGGFAQLIVTWLIKETGSLLAPSFYVMFGATVGLVSAYFINDRRKHVEGA